MDFLHDLDATEEGLHVSYWDDVAEGWDEIDYSCRAKQFHLQITLPNHPKDGEIDVSQHTHVLKTKPWYQEGAQDYAASDGMGGGRRIQPRRPTGRGAVVVSHQFGISPTLFGINPKKEKLDCFGKWLIDWLID